MLDLDALVQNTIKIKLGGREYEAPCGLDSMPLAAVVAGKSAQQAIQKLADGGDCDDDDVQRIFAFLHAATGIPVEHLQGMPMPKIGAILQAILPPSEESAPVADPPQA